MKVINSVRLELHRERLDLIADFIKNALKVDVRENTVSRAHDLPQYRCLFFQMVLQTTKIDKATIGGYLGKDHATVVHSTKMWENTVRDFLGKYLIAYLKIKDDVSLLLPENVALEYELKIEKLESEIESLKLELDTQKNNIIKNTTNRYLMALMELEDKTVRLFIETRLQPFLKMNKLNLKLTKPIKRSMIRTSNLTKTTNKMLNIDVVV